MPTGANDNSGSGFSTAFLGEPAYRWMGFAIAAIVFLWLWGRIIRFLAGEV